MNCKLITLLSLLPILLLASVDSSAIRAYEKKISTHSSRSDSLKNLITHGEKKIKKLKNEENSTIRQLHEIEQNIELTQALIEELAVTADSLAEDMAQARHSVDSVGVELDKRQAIMEERLRQIYKSGKVTLPSIIFGSASAAEALHRIRFAQDLNRYDRSILDKIREDQRRRNTEVAILSIQNSYYQDILNKKAEEKVLLSSQIEERKELINSIQQEKEKWLAKIESLKKAQQELHDLVKNLIKQRDAASEELAKKLNFSFAKRKEKMLWPIQGEIVSAFGRQTHPEYGTSIINKGVSIAGKKGEAVRAVAPGIVEFVGRLPGYGKVLILNHYDGYLTIYAHLGAASMKKGVEAAAGDNLGTIGGSTSDDSTLHFEIRKGTDALDPLLWLRKKEF